MSEPLRFVLFGAGYWARPQLAAWGELPGARCAGIDMISGFPLFQQQPFLREVEQFILADLGSHTLDLARFLFGEAHDVACVAGRAHAGIRGEDHATVMMRM
ncbi:MAG: Gfo/Idh/MocA family protein, partial [Opitutaceae bacterium]